MGRTTIEWTDYSWPITNGCARCSPGCENCYAELLTATRLRKQPKYAGLAIYRDAGTDRGGPRWTRKSRLWWPELDKPLRIAKPSKIFVADMGDLFFEEVEDEEIVRVLGTIAACHALGKGHVFQALTKRASRMADLMSHPGTREAVAKRALRHLLRRRKKAAAMVLRDWLVSDAAAWPLPNLWLGVSVEDRRRAAERMPHLRRTPTVVPYVSYEPALEGVDPMAFDGARWIIVGGESGRKARPFDVAWARAVVERYRGTDTAVFIKQLGSKPCFSPVREDGGTGGFLSLEHGKGSDMAEWPSDLRVREFPEPRMAAAA